LVKVIPETLNYISAYEQKVSIMMVINSSNINNTNGYLSS